MRDIHYIVTILWGKEDVWRHLYMPIAPRVYNMLPLQDALQNIRVRGNNCEVWPWRAGDKKWSETAGRVARQRSLVTRCLSPAKQRVLGPDLVPALGLTGFQICLLPELTELMKSPRIPKVSAHGGGETTSNAGALQLGSGCVAARRRLHRDPAFLYAIIIALKGSPRGNYLPVLYRPTRM